MRAGPDVPYERAKNAEYLVALEKKLKTRIEIGIARNEAWANPGGVTLPFSPDDLHPLIGRVGLESPHELLGTDFYIGPRRLVVGGVEVYSCFAEVAKLFYQPDGGGFEGHESVVVRRTFEARHREVVAADDEWVRDVMESPFAARKLGVPAAPVHRPRRRFTLDRERDAPTQPELLIVQDDAKVATAEHTHIVRPPLGTRSPVGMRAVEAVRRRLSAPRSSQLTSVLATLQPDQYEMATSDPRQDLVVQGHPGTGKTIIATYRAAFLVDPDREGNSASRVLLVGPTKQYVNHVQGILRQHDPEGRIQATHIESLLSNFVASKSSLEHTFAGRYDDLDAHTRGLCEIAAHKVRQLDRFAMHKDVRSRWLRTTYELLRTNGQSGRTQLTDNPAEVAWLKNLPTFELASSQRRYLPLLAQCALALRAPTVQEQYDHIVVDEAQDMSPIEWNILDQMKSKAGRWTLVGDMNQRRSDTSYESWEAIAHHLGIGSGDTQFQATTITRGYRSTAQILELADKLLPRAQRGVEVVQRDGPGVQKIWASNPQKLFSISVDIAVDFKTRYSDGMVAIISAEPTALTQWMARHGWRRDRSVHRWVLGGQLLNVYGPASARGLEFDAVVVVEPSKFKQHVGKAGQLYTSLTRANRELAIVWQKNLPQALR
ncbi:UvrD-helicase domain-containing protein [Aeromicrobium yanjiei]|uniref:AAA family ATPase n=1 Tax=Aeromicrobium yanjiei TaxID=2662028 RepID=A0A5Q2MJE3_9ACTN|nr:UvrD-helicase domain-containing protein [Aeromicrobium yanjiei]QGG41851.1 AAA family ATPase [Aeromicrobium yanjiei]